MKVTQMKSSRIVKWIACIVAVVAICAAFIIMAWPKFSWIERSASLIVSACALLVAAVGNEYSKKVLKKSRESSDCQRPDEKPVVSSSMDLSSAIPVVSESSHETRSSDDIVHTVQSRVPINSVVCNVPQATILPSQDDGELGTTHQNDSEHHDERRLPTISVSESNPLAKEHKPLRTLNYVNRTIADDTSQALTIDTVTASNSKQDDNIRFLPPPSVNGFVERTGLQRRLVEEITTASFDSAILLSGFPGSGKTSLAALLCNDQQIKERFKDRVLWLTVGQSRIGSSLAEFIGDVCVALGGKRPSTQEPLLAGAILGDILEENAASLIVIDDVWSSEQAEPFLRGARNCLRIFTARSSAVLPTAINYDVKRMTPDESYTTLTKGLSSGYEALAQPLLKIADGWPLVLGIMNAAIRSMANSGFDPKDAASWVVNLANHPSLLSTGEVSATNFSRSVEATLHLLKDRERVLELGIFKDDILVPLTVVESLWKATGGYDEIQSTATLSNLFNLRLAELTVVNSVYYLSLHDLLRSYFREVLGETRIISINMTLINHWRKHLLPQSQPTAWWELSSTCEFEIENLPWHLEEAGLTEELLQLAVDLRWIETQVGCLGSVLSSISTLRSRHHAIFENMANFLSSNLDVFLPDPEPIIVSTLLGRAQQYHYFAQLTHQRARCLESPVLLPVWSLPDLDLKNDIQHYGPIGDCSISFDGAYLASASDDGFVILWRTVDLVPVRVFAGHKYRARACSFSPLGDRLISSGMDGTVRLWQVESGHQEKIFGDRSAPVLGACWSHDGRRIAGVDRLGRVTVWDVANGDSVMQVCVDNIPQWSCVFDRSDDNLIVCDEQGSIRVWDVNRGSLISSKKVHVSRLRCVAISPQGTRLAVAGNDGYVATIDYNNGALRENSIRPLVGHSRRVRWCVFSNDGLLLASAGEDRSVRVWNTRTGDLLTILTGHTDWVGGCTFSPSGSVLYTCSGDASIRRWDVESGAELNSVVGSRVPTESLDIHSDGSIIIGRADGVVEKLRSTDGKPSDHWQAHTGRVLGIAGNNEVIATGGSDGMIKGWRTPDSRLFCFESCAGRIMQLRANHSAIGAVAEDGEVTLMSADGSAVRKVMQAHQGHTLGCAFNANGCEFVTCGDDGSLAFWDSVSLHLLRRISMGHGTTFWDLAFSSDGHWLVATGEPDGMIYRWNLSTGDKDSFYVDNGRLSGCAISSNDKFLAVCGESGLLTVWDLRSCSLITGVRVAAPLRRVAWSQSTTSSYVVAGGSAGTYRFKLLLESPNLGFSSLDTE